MGLLRTAALIVMGFIVVKSMKRIIASLEAQQVKARVREPQKGTAMKSLKLDPITGVYVPEA